MDAAQTVKTVDMSEDAMKNRVKLQKGTKEAIKDAAPKTKDGSFIDPNTGKPIEKGQEVYGHKTGEEWSKYKKDPANQNKTKKKLLKIKMILINIRLRIKSLMLHINTKKRKRKNDVR